MARLQVQGLAKLQVAFAAAAARAASAAAVAVRQEVDAVADDAESDVPVDKGELKASLRREASGLRGSVEATAGHAGHVEFGTSKTPAQPFMGPAVERSRKRFPAKAAATIKASLEGLR